MQYQHWLHRERLNLAKSDRFLLSGMGKKRETATDENEWCVQLHNSIYQASEPVSSQVQKNYIRTI